jgi:hypothetical protein
MLKYLNMRRRSAINDGERRENNVSAISAANMGESATISKARENLCNA